MMETESRSMDLRRDFSSVNGSPTGVSNGFSPSFISTPSPEPGEAYILEPERPTADDMDQKRKEQLALEYLCRLDEAKTWMEECLNVKLPSAVELDETMRNGVLLALVSNYFAPQSVPIGRVFDPKEERYQNQGLHFRHTDNTTQWIRAMRDTGFPEVFIPDTTDVYDKKNMPKAVFCIHALSLYLYRKGLAPPMRDNSGNVAFTTEEINMVADALAEQGIKLPPFSKIGGILAEELSKDEAELHAAVVRINDAVESRDWERTLATLGDPKAGINFVLPERGGKYQDVLYESKRAKTAEVSGDSAVLEDMYDGLLTREEIQTLVDSTNESESMRRLNECLGGEDAQVFVKSLQDPILHFPRVTSSYGALYHTEFLGYRDEKNRDLERDDVHNGIKVINAVIDLNAAVAKAERAKLSAALENPQLHVQNVNSQYVEQYQESLSEVQAGKAQESCPWLTHKEIQKIVDSTNAPFNAEEKRATQLAQISQLLQSEDDAALEEVLRGLLTEEDAAKLNPKNLPLYRHLLARRQAECESAGQSMSIEEIRSLIDQANDEVEQGRKALQATRKTNALLESEKAENVGEVLSLAQLHVDSRPSIQKEYVRRLKVVKDKKCERNLDEPDGSWLLYNTSSYYKLYGRVCPSPTWVDLNEVAMELPPNEHLSSTHLNFHEITKEIKIADDVQQHFESNEKRIVKTQAQVRMWSQRKKYVDRLEYLKKQEEYARKIQNFVRRKQSSVDFKSLMSSDAPSLDLVRKFADFVVRTEVDYEEEIEIQTIRSEMTKEVRANQKLEEDLNVMDLKIGLLVKNILDLEEVMRHGQKLKSHDQQMDQSENKKNPRTISKGKGKMEFYQTMLYILQTDSQYLSYLLLSTKNSPKSLERMVDYVIFPLFGYASQRREEYFMTKFLHRVVSEEIRSSLRHLDDIHQDRLMTPRIAVHFAKQSQAESMKEVLEPVARRLLTEEDQSLHVNTDPLEIYKYLVGEPPAEMTELEASKHPEVQKVLDFSMKYIGDWATRFFETIVERPDNIPYMVRYVAKTMTKSVKEKMPNVSDKHLLKIVGYLIYSQYLRQLVGNPDLSGDGKAKERKELTSEQKKTFVSISKLLQFATSNKGFGNETAYLSPLNETIRSFHERFRIYFSSIISVPEPEDFYGYDHFTEHTIHRRPVVVMSVGDIHFLQESLLSHINSICPDPHDQLRTILSILGPSTIENVAGVLCDASGEEKLSSITVTLLLKGKLKLPTEDPVSEIRHTFLSTKKLVLDVILSQKGESIPVILDTPATEADEDAHWKLKERFQQPGSRKSILDSDQYSLEEKKSLIRKNLETLEEQGLVSRENDYQAIINAIATDVRQESKQRNQRRKELGRLRKNLDETDAKRQYYRDQINYYNQYIQGCLQNMDPKLKRRSMMNPVDSKKGTPSKIKPESVSRQVVKCSGEKLTKKGVLLQINDLSLNQMKSVNFEFVHDDNPGVFDVTVRFPDKTEEKCQLQLQDLLKTQYEGVENLKILHKISLSISPLILFINKKFYCS